MTWKRFDHEFPKHGQLIIAIQMKPRLQDYIINVYLEDMESNIDDWIMNFTHWMPLPTLPSETSDQIADYMDKIINTF